VIPALRTTAYCLHLGLAAACATLAVAPAAIAAEPDRIEAGRAIAHDWYKGNCLACHQIPGDPTAETLANIGPPIIGMRERFPDRAELRARLWDPTLRNPLSYMPPYGKHGVLTGEEIDLVIDYLYQY
jgi:sulfur-oxidizing protein SoxX